MVRLFSLLLYIEKVSLQLASRWEFFDFSSDSFPNLAVHRSLKNDQLDDLKQFSLSLVERTRVSQLMTSFVI